MSKKPLSDVLRPTSSRFASRVLRLTLLALFTIHFSLFTARAEEWGFSFSGQLLQVVDQQKTVVQKDGSKNYAATIYVRLYDDSEATATLKSQAIWGRCIDVHVKNGTFSCELKDSAGDGQPLAGTAHVRLQDAFAALGGSVVTVGVTPFDDKNAEISPRQRLAAVPFAVNAGDALGTVGDVTIPGTLKTGAFKAAADVTFGGTVSHAGNATFRSDPRMPRLSLGDSESLKVKTMTVGEDMEVKRVEAGTLTTGEAAVKVGKLAGGSVSNLVVAGAVTADALKPVGQTLETSGNVSVRDLVVKDFVLGGGMDMFQWAAEPTKLERADEEAFGYYTGSAANGYWTATCNCLMSLSFRLENSVTVKLSTKDGEIEAGTIQASGSGSGWFPFQVFLRSGQVISWTGGSEILVVYREFRY